MGFKKFNLDARLLAATVRAGYSMPTPVQAVAIPAALAGHDIIGTAQTGTGKTAAFVLPILQKLLAGRHGKTRALILTPTRELAEQIHDAFRAFGSGIRIRSATVYGGVSPAPQIHALKNGFEILVACPGRLLDHIGQGLVDFKSVEVLVLDEADRMFDMGFLPSVRKILARVPSKRQTLLFSATFPKEIEELASEALRHPKRIAIGLSRPAHTVAHALYPVPQHLKTRLLVDLLRVTGAGSVLIFTRTKHRAEKLARQIKHEGYETTSLHSNRSQGQRQSALNGFKDGTYQIMVATDIAARGLDVENISHVINFDMPDTPDAYIHRIGRTGRAERNGDAFTFVTPEDEAMVKTLEKIMNQSLERRTLDGFQYSSPAPARQAERGRFQRPFLRSTSERKPLSRMMEKTPAYGR
ncbi:DEAD/DEAH box helicase [bacterium]|nr:DEAD/DEAH box helicase [bacterium]